MDGYIQDLHRARRRQGHTCRSLAETVGVSHEAVSRLERAQKGSVGTVQAIAAGLGYDIRLFTADGKLLMHGLNESAHIGEQLSLYRRDVLRRPRKAFGLSFETMVELEREPFSMPIGDFERYTKSLGLILGLTRRLN